MPLSVHRPASWLAWGVFALAGTEVLAAVVLALATRMSWHQPAINSITGVALATSGWQLARQRARNPIGWLLLTAAVLHATGTLTSALLEAAAITPGLLALLVFPDGRYWRPVAIAVAAASLLSIFWVATGNPLWTIGPVAALVTVIGTLALRYRRGDEVLRRQLLWLVFALACGLIALIPWALLRVGPELALAAIPLVPAAVAVAVLRYRLLDVRLMVSRALLYLLLMIGAIAVYMGLVVLLGPRSGALVAVLIALVFDPVRGRLQRVLDHLFYGQRRDPVRALSHLSERLDADTTTLDNLLTAVREALQLPYAAFRLRGREVAASGSAAGTLEVVPLAASGAASGELVIGVRPGQNRLNSQDMHVLSVLAIPLGVALRATMLSEELQLSRERIVAAREEERRRLRRDLHDGLGPTLSGVAYATDAARNLARSDPDTAEDLLIRLRGDIGDAIVEIRRLVEGLRPPALDELGLVGALHREAERLSYQDGGRPLTVSVDAPPDMPELPAAVEVAAYRISAEALNNAAKHSGAEHVRVRITVGEELHIQVHDDGIPGPEDWLPGVGMSSMSERAAEVGGRCQARSSPEGGNVEAVLPLKPM